MRRGWRKDASSPTQECAAPPIPRLTHAPSEDIARGHRSPLRRLPDKPASIAQARKKIHRQSEGRRPADQASRLTPARRGSWTWRPWRSRARCRSRFPPAMLSSAAPIATPIATPTPMDAFRFMVRPDRTGARRRNAATGEGRFRQSWPDQQRRAGRSHRGRYRRPCGQRCCAGGRRSDSGCSRPRSRRPWPAASRRRARPE